MNVLFLAAGLGARLRPLTNKHPKPCVPFLNVPLGLYPFRFFSGLSVDSLVVNTFHLPKQIVTLYLQQNFFRGDITFSHEASKILGSAGGLKQAAGLFKPEASDDTILMLNADEVLFDVNSDFLEKAYEQHRSQNNLATLVVMKHPEAGKKFGAIWCKGDRVVHIGKAASQQGQTPLHYIGMIFLAPEVLELIPEQTESNIFYDVLINKLESNRVGVHEINCRWYETGNPEDFLRATKDSLEKIDVQTRNFIDSFDPSQIIENASGKSLISNYFANHSFLLDGYNVISKTTNPNLLLNSGSLSNSICFENEILNESYFKASPL